MINFDGVSKRSAVILFFSFIR